jgi:catechol 2,3-dioxygenase-like lactoylglutathione lyase family enzyme
MFMFDHVMINVSDKAKSKAFYIAALKVLGIEMRLDEGAYVAFGPKGRYLFWLNQSEKSKASERVHLAFSADSRAHVNDFHNAGLATGGRSNGEPGLRIEHGPNYYAAFVLDPDGNNIEAVCYKES